MKRTSVYICAALAGSVASAEDAVNWVTSGLSFPNEINTVGTWSVSDGVIFAVDALTLQGTQWPMTDFPTHAAQVIGIQEQMEDGRTAAMLLVWADDPVTCGEDLTTIGVDTGLAAFMGSEDPAALEAYGEAYDGDIYDGPYGEQIDTKHPGPFLVDVPGLSGFPVTGSGWGDGGYPVASLKNSRGDIVALYVQFITEGADWHLPPPCKTPES